MQGYDNGPTAAELRIYGSHAGFAWATQDQRAAIDSAGSARALALAAAIDEPPLSELLSEERDPQDLMRYIAISIIDYEPNSPQSATERFWREVAISVGMENFDDIPHKQAFIRGFLEAQWIVFNQSDYHNIVLDNL